MKNIAAFTATVGYIYSPPFLSANQNDDGTVTLIARGKEPECACVEVPMSSDELRAFAEEVLRNLSMASAK